MLLAFKTQFIFRSSYQPTILRKSVPVVNLPICLSICLTGVLSLSQALKGPPARARALEGLTGTVAVQGGRQFTMLGSGIGSGCGSLHNG